MSVKIINGDCRDVLRSMPDQSVHCCVTSPPYFGLRDYGVDGQIGLEETPDAFVAEMVALFREVRRVLRDDGTLWLNLGDSYANDTKWGGSTSGKHVRAQHGDSGIGRRRQNTGLKSKDLIGIPWRVAFALQADGWYLRQDIIWSKPNPMPESVTDRCTKAHEYLFLLSKGPRYHYDAEAIKEESVTNDPRRPYGSPGANALDPRGEQGAGKVRAPVNRKRGEFDGKTNAMPGREAFRAFTETRNKRSVWTVATEAYSEAHFATFPPSLIEPCIKAGCPEGGTVLDPFGGAGTTGLVADRLQRNAILIELNPAYAEMARSRVSGDAGMFAEVA
jgi:DNA modification methylase